MLQTTYWPRLAVLLAIDIALGLLYAALPVSFGLGRHGVAALQLIALAGTMVFTLARVSRDF